MPKTVLLADNSVTIQRVVALTFANADINITSVRDGNQAIEAITRRPPDLILADIGMSGRNGYQVAEFVRSQPGLSKVPVLLLAGAFEPVDEVQARRVGADGVLTKPFEPSTLVAQVTELLETGRRDPSRQQEAHILPVDALIQKPYGTSKDGRAQASLDALSSLEAGPRTSSSDIYFDQIDQAFEALAKSPRPPVHLVPDVRQEAEIVAREAMTHIQDSAGPTPEIAAAKPMAPEPITSDLSVLEHAAPERGAQAVGLTDAFNALLDAERAGVVMTSLPHLALSPVAPPVDVEALAAQVAQRVLEQLSDRVVRETVAEIVSRTAERIVREEIEHVKRNIT